MHLRAFLLSALRSATSGDRRYHLWMGSLTAIMLVGGYAYLVQANHGLVVTGMNDHVSWGLYISNMAFLVGVAAAAVILVMPAYVLHDVDFSRAVLIAEGVAVSALVMCLGFVMANSPGYPWKWWRLTPVIGLLNWPSSMLAWDVIALNGYLVLNLAIPFYILYSHFTGREPAKKKYVPFIYLSVVWAVSIHLITAFLFAAPPSRPLWNSPLLGPRFLASAFTAGPAFMILLLGFIRSTQQVPHFGCGHVEAGHGHYGGGADQPGDALFRSGLRVLLSHASQPQREVSLLRPRRAPRPGAVDQDRRSPSTSWRRSRS